jgi:hypothetical protein
MGPEAAREQKKAIQQASEAAQRRKEAESAPGLSWWKRLRYRFRP